METNYSLDPAMFLTHSNAEMARHQQLNCCGREDTVEMFTNLCDQRVNHTRHKQELVILPQRTWTLVRQPTLMYWAHRHHFVPITVSWSEEVGLVFLK